MSGISPEEYDSFDAYVDALIDHIEQLQAERRWISVKDRLPENDQFVIAYHVNWGIELTQWYQHRWREIGLGDDTPSHWMPLPKPPEE